MGKTPRNADRTLLILDLDETLIHARKTPLERPADFHVFDYHVYRRPHLAAFIAAAKVQFHLAVWSTASDDYAHAIVENIFADRASLHFIWGRSRATLPRGPKHAYRFGRDGWNHLEYVKPLTKVKRLGWRLERVLIVDDSPEKCARNYGNAIYPKPYKGEKNDDELLLLGRYLSTLKDEPDVRRIEKRWWRQTVALPDER